MVHVAHACVITPLLQDLRGTAPLPAASFLCWLLPRIARRIPWHKRKAPGHLPRPRRSGPTIRSTVTSHPEPVHLCRTDDNWPWGTLPLSSASAPPQMSTLAGAHGTADQEKHQCRPRTHGPSCFPARSASPGTLACTRTVSRRRVPDQFWATRHKSRECSLPHRQPSWTGEPASLCEHGTNVYPGPCFLDRSAEWVVEAAGVELLQPSLGTQSRTFRRRPSHDVCP